MRNILLLAVVSLILLTKTAFAITAPQTEGDFNRRLTPQERETICTVIQNNQQQIPEDPDPLSGKGVIPDSVLSDIYHTTRKMNIATSDVLVLGQALTCHAIYAAKNNVTILGITLMFYPNIPVWLCGAVIYLLGFFMTLSIAFYLVDISFKLGFAIIMLPIGIALWPFAWTKDKLVTIVSIILKSAAIFAFLALIITYALELLSSAIDGTEELFRSIDENKVEYVAERFSLTSNTFLLCLFALVYGIKMIGSAIPDYVDKFFPDGVFGSGDSASPMHMLSTQALDFAKKKTLDPIASYAGDVAKTQAGNLIKGSGKLITGGYNKQLKTAAHYVTNPSKLANLAVNKTGNLVVSATSSFTKGGVSFLSGTIGRVFLSKNARASIRTKLNQSIDSGANWSRQQVNNLGNFTEASLKSPTAALRGAGHSMAWATSNIEKGVTLTLTRALSVPFLDKKKRQKLEAKLMQEIDNNATELRGISDNVKGGIDNAVKSRLRRFTQSRTIRSVAGRVSRAGNATGRGIAKGYKGITTGYDNIISTIDKRMARANNKKERKLKDIDENFSTRFEQIANSKNAVMNRIAKAKTSAIGRIDKGKKWLFRQMDRPANWLGKRVDNLVKDKSNDSTITTFFKRGTRAILKAPLSAPTALAKVPFRILSGATKFATRTTFAVPQIATSTFFGTKKLFLRTQVGIKKIPARISSGAYKLPGRIFKPIVQIFNLNSWRRGVGSVLMHVGDQMTRNKKTRKQIADENRRKQEEEDERRRLRELEEARRSDS